MVRVAPVSRLRTVTVALGTAAPDVSCTVPEIDPVTCADTGVEAVKSTNMSRRTDKVFITVSQEIRFQRGANRKARATAVAAIRPRSSRHRCARHLDR